MSRIKSALLACWNAFFRFRARVREFYFNCKDAVYVRHHEPPAVLPISDSLRRVLDEELSVARFGDGEVKLIAGRNISFQKYDPRLQEALIRTISYNEPGFMVCLSDVFGDRSGLYRGDDLHWKRHLAEFRPYWYKYLHKGVVYGNTFMTRCYVQMRDKSLCAEQFDLLKQIWAGKDLLIVEGEKSRLGIGNDLFDGARSIERILGPATSAFTKHDELLAAAKAHGKDKLILLALGPTATVMSLELFEAGYRAVDLGHADIEYEWFLAGAKGKVAVKNKYVNEAGPSGHNIGDLQDETYQSQIIERIL